MLKDKIVLLILIISCITRLLFIINNNGALKMNPDEISNYEVASNTIKGLGYTHFDETTKSYKATAFHGTFPVFTYQFLISNNIPVSYWVVGILGMSFILFFVSILYFIKILNLLNIKGKIFYFALAFFCFYPSYQYYVGSIFAYENVVLPLLVINFYYFLKILYAKNGFGLTILNSIFIIFSVGLSCLYRPQTIFVYFIVFLILFLIIIFKYPSKVKGYITFLSCLVVAVSLLHIPILVKNQKLFGKPILSTQTGFELLQGHNPHARGSWNGQWGNPDSEFYKYVLASSPNIDKLDEYSESKIRKNIAFEFVKNNPTQEIVLIFRKVAIFFLPKNYEVLPTFDWYNPLNLIVHLLFIISCIYLFIHYKRITRFEILILSPVLGVLLLSIIFFVGYRWRYYCEPFMILFIGIIGSEFMKRKKNHEQSKISN